VAITFVLTLGRGLHACGYPAHRLEDALVRASRRLGLEAQFFSMPTALFASFGPPGDQQTFQLRVEPGGVELGRQEALVDVAEAVAAGALTLEDAARTVAAVEAAPPPYGPALSTLAFALTSGAACRFFGGGLREIAAATAIGLAIGLLAVLAERVPTLGRVFEPVAAAMAAFLAGVAAAFVPPLSPYTATVAGLIVLIPGFTLTTAMIELATRNLVSGTARFAGAAATFLAIGFGVALGRQVSVALFGAAPPVAVAALPPWTEFAALAVAPLGFTVLLRARARDAGWIALAGALGFGGTRLGAIFLGPELGAFVGALVLGLATHAYARALGRVEVVPLVPGLLLLVPGSLGFRSLNSLVQGETVLGVEAAFRMALVAIALAVGVLFASVLLPARRRPA
jgi:uncharacterized membrane protein YjjP (DUF1212 family)